MRGMSPDLDRPYDRILKSQRDTRLGTRLGKEIADRDLAAESHGPKHTAIADDRGGRRVHSGGPSFRELYAEAERRGLKDRSKMTKAQLERALGRG